MIVLLLQAAWAHLKGVVAPFLCVVLAFVVGIAVGYGLAEKHDADTARAHLSVCVPVTTIIHDRDLADKASVKAEKEILAHDTSIDTAVGRARKRLDAVPVAAQCPVAGDPHAAAQPVEGGDPDARWRAVWDAVDGVWRASAQAQPDGAGDAGGGDADVPGSASAP